MVAREHFRHDEKLRERERERERERDKDAVWDGDAFAQMRVIFFNKSYDGFSLISYDEPRLSNADEIIT